MEVLSLDNPHSLSFHPNKAGTSQGDQTLLCRVNQTGRPFQIEMVTGRRVFKICKGYREFTPAEATSLAAGIQWFVGSSVLY